MLDIRNVIKSASLQSNFYFWEQPKVIRGQVWWIRRMIQFRNWFLARNSSCFFSSLKILESIFAEIFLIPKSPVKIFLTVYLYKFNYSSIILTLNRLPDRTNCRTLYTFSQLCWVFGCPGHSSSFTPSRPPLNTLCHSDTLYFFNVLSPLATLSMS